MRITARIDFSPDVITAEAAAGLVGQSTSVDGHPGLITAAELDDINPSHAVTLTVELPDRRPGDFPQGAFTFSPRDRPLLLRSPDCRDGKHTSCTGDGWNDTTGQPTDCPCPCHLPITDYETLLNDGDQP